MGHDAAMWRVHAQVDKWSEDATRFARMRSGLRAPRAAVFAELGVSPDEVVEQPGNLLVTAGLTRLMSLLNGAGRARRSPTPPRGSARATVPGRRWGDTDLGAAAGSANRWFQVMDATFPSVSANVLTAKATFASADGNYAWNEVGPGYRHPHRHLVRRGQRDPAQPQDIRGPGHQDRRVDLALTVTITIT